MDGSQVGSRARLEGATSKNDCHSPTPCAFLFLSRGGVPSPQHQPQLGRRVYHSIASGMKNGSRWLVGVNKRGDGTGRGGSKMAIGGKEGVWCLGKCVNIYRSMEHECKPRRRWCHRWISVHVLCPSSKHQCVSRAATRVGTSCGRQSTAMSLVRGSSAVSVFRWKKFVYLKLLTTVNQQRSS
jgi:hypothetical protein